MGTNLKNGGQLLSAIGLRDSLNQKPDISVEPTMLSQFQKDLLLQGEGEIDEALEEADEVLPFRYSITSHGADYPVDALVKRVAAKDIVIPEFQRGYVWSLKEASRFVESLLLGLPVPSIFLSEEAETQQLLVIDGQQRLLSLYYYYDGIWPSARKEFALKGVQKKFEGLTYKGLSSEDRRRLDNSTVHAIIVRQDEPSDDASSIHLIFERLNTSGVSLTPHEIRAAIQHGEFSRLLKTLNQTEAWRAIYGTLNKLMRDQELILRFLALYYDSTQYSRPMKDFLNKFMGRHRHLTIIPKERITGVFVTAIELINRSIGKTAFRIARVLNAAVFDSVMIGVARRLEKGKVTDLGGLSRHYNALLADPKFLEVAERATADEKSVSERIRLATNAFAQVP